MCLSMNDEILQDASKCLCVLTGIEEAFIQLGTETLLLCVSCPKLQPYWVPRCSRPYALSFEIGVYCDGCERQRRVAIFSSTLDPTANQSDDVGEDLVIVEMARTSMRKP